MRTSPNDPQRNGKRERWHGILKSEEFHNKTPANVREARRVVGNFVTHSNEVCLHSALGYAAPHHKLAGRERRFRQPRQQTRGRSCEATRCQVTRCRAGDHTHRAHVTLTVAVQCDLTWTEYKASVRTDPSAVPGAETEGRADAFNGTARSSLRDRHLCGKPSRPEAATEAAWSRPLFPYALHARFQFTVKQGSPVRLEIQSMQFPSICFARRSPA